MLKKTLLTLSAPFVFIFAWLLMARIVRHFYKFPMPQFMADAIDNPLRRKMQPPEKLAVRHGIQPGMTVLDIGPGNGTYTMAAACRVGPEGKVFAVDIEPRMIERVNKKAAEMDIKNVEARVADVYDMPYGDQTFDVITMITVIGEIPQPQRALAECERVLKADGFLSISELLFDPDSSLPSTMCKLVESAGYVLHEKTGNTFAYTMQFRKDKAENGNGYD